MRKHQGLQLSLTWPSADTARKAKAPQALWEHTGTQLEERKGKTGLHNKTSSSGMNSKFILKSQEPE